MSRVQSKYRELVADGVVASSNGDSHDEAHPHVVSVGLLAAVLAVLLVLTVVTVGVSELRLGDAAIFVALAVAVVKAAFVVLYFMHLRWDSLFNSVILIGSLLFVAIFLAFTLVDTAEYKPNVDAAVVAPAP